MIDIGCQGWEKDARGEGKGYTQAFCKICKPESVVALSMWVGTNGSTLKHISTLFLRSEYTFYRIFYQHRIPYLKSIVTVLAPSKCWK